MSNSKQNRNLLPQLSDFTRKSPSLSKSPTKPPHHIRFSIIGQQSLPFLSPPFLNLKLKKFSQADPLRWNDSTTRANFKSSPKNSEVQESSEDESALAKKLLRLQNEYVALKRHHQTRKEQFKVSLLARAAFEQMEARQERVLRQLNEYGQK